MSKNKLEKFDEMKGFANVLQPYIKQTVKSDFETKGHWHEKYFKNNNLIVLELGCGKGEYTIGLAERFRDFNYAALDIKGARIWRGAKLAIEKQLTHVFFLRTKIDLINSFFAENEVSEIWITFPDPQPKKQNKRLTSAYFLNLYRNILKNNGIVHLKTDSDLMYFYTKKLAESNNLQIIKSTHDLYNSTLVDDVLSIKTFYEQQFLAENKSIKYISFHLPKDKEIEEIEKFKL